MQVVRSPKRSIRNFSYVLSLILCGWLWWPIASVQADTQLTWLDAPQPAAEFKKVTGPQQWQFPQDFGAHEDYQTEWWYYTGNLKSTEPTSTNPSDNPSDNPSEARSFGFQLTFFRQSLSPQSSQAIAVTNAANSSGATNPPGSRWRSNQVYSAHFTVSDIADRQFYPYERFSRSSIDLAGAAAEPYHVWLEDWNATEIAPGQVRLSAKTPEVAIDLVVSQTLPPVLQGDRGYSVKGLEPGNASYYYSLVQQPTAGSITIGSHTYRVAGHTWKDHEYSTSALTAGTVGWDWFSLQFNDGGALMLYLLRHDDGTIESTSAGTYIAPDGQTQVLSGQDWQINVLDTWKSPKSRATYPAKWTIAIPKLNLALQGQAQIPNQELNTSTATYWEGAVAFSGSQGDRSLRGEGYVELTGYADRLDALLSSK